MRCPFCMNEESVVKDSRETGDGSAVRRRRLCPACDGRWTTFERVQLRELVVIKRSGRREEFDREKLERSIGLALARRPVDPAVLDMTIARLVRRLESQGDTEIPSHVIGHMTLEALRALDQVAYVRFASVYREFARADDFAAFLREQSL